jgi:ABC-2 type transport system permease protein
MNNREKLVAYQTIATKEILRFTRIWVQTVLPPVITTALYFIIFGNLIGPRIGEMEGFGYMEFIIPGLIMWRSSPIPTPTWCHHFTVRNFSAISRRW